MNPFLPDDVDVLLALTRAWPEVNMVVLGAVALARIPGWAVHPRHEQRWQTAASIAVDLFPASVTALKMGFVEWPRTGFRMSLLGMRLAFEHPFLCAWLRMWRCELPLFTCSPH